MPKQITNLKSSNKENDSFTVEKIWSDKLDFYRNHCNQSDKFEQLPPKHPKPVKTTEQKIKQDFSTSIATMPGSNLCKHNTNVKHEYEKPARKAVYNHSTSKIVVRKPIHQSSQSTL